MNITKIQQCENLTPKGSTCEDFYNCCDCGTDSLSEDWDGGCGCRYCWSCNACEYCLTVEE